MMEGRRRQTILALVVVFLLVLGWIELIGPLPGDRAVRHWFTVHRPAPWLLTLRDFTGALAEPVIALITVALAAVVTARRRGPDAAGFLLACAGVVAVVAVLKHLIGTTDPWADIVGSHERNFPSGHVAYAAAVFGGIAWLADDPRDRDVRVAALAVVVLMGPARVASGAHLVSDMLAGYAVGLAWMLAMAALIAPARR